MEAVEAKSLKLRDDKGRLRLWIGTASGDGNPYIFFHDDKGHPRLRIQLADENRSSITLDNAKQHPSITIGHALDDSPNIAFPARRTGRNPDSPSAWMAARRLHT